MAVTYTLEEAAAKLGIPSDEFRKRLKTEWTHLRPMRDGITLRFKDKDVEELARQIGMGSEEQLQLADPSSTEKVIPKELGNIDDSDPDPPALNRSKSPAFDAPLVIPDDPIELGGGKEVFLVDETQKPKAKSSSDSDVRLERSNKPKPSAKKKDRDGTDEIELDVLPSSASPSGKMTSASSSTKLKKGDKKSSTSSGKLAPSSKSHTGKSGKLPAVAPPTDPDSSEFELTLDHDSSDEFELSLATDSSDEISLGDAPPPSKAGASGINLGKPIDSGINLEKKNDSDKRKGGASDSGKRKSEPVKTDSDEEIEFELSLDQAGASSKKLGSGVSKNIAPQDSDSEFELTLDETSDAEGLGGEVSALEDEGKNDIFETDFEIPALDDDSASEAVAIDEADTDLESSSDFDLAIDEGDVSADEESASQVVVLDDETNEAPAPGKKKPAAKGKKKALLETEESEMEADEAGVDFDEMELDEGESASKALQGAAAGDEDEEEEEGERVAAAEPASWGVFPALVMLPTVFIAFLGAIMAYELVHSMWGYQQSTKPASLIINKVAEALDMQPKD